MNRCFNSKSFYLVVLLWILLQPLPVLSMGQPVIRIGFNYPQSGPYSQIGKSQFQGARLAVEEINAQGGILNHQVELVVRDSGSHVRRTKGNIKELLDKEKVQMIFGGVSSAVAIAACELCQEQWIPFFGTLTYSTATTGEEAHRACFRESYNSWMAARVLAGYMNRHHKYKRYFYITADYTWGWTTEQSIRELTGTIDPQRHRAVRTRLGTTNFIKALRIAEAAEPDVLIVILAGMDLETALRQATVMGLKDRVIMIVPNLIRTDIVRIGPEAMEGVIGAMPWLWQVPYIYNYRRGMDFVEQFKAQYQDYPTSAAASAYTILHEYRSAVEKAGSFEGPEVIEALEDHTYQIVKDEQRWRAFDHQSIQTVYLVKGKPATQNSDDVIDLDHLEILETMPGFKAARSYEQWLTIRRKARKYEALESFPEQ